MEVSGNTAWFRERLLLRHVLAYMARMIFITPAQFEVIVGSIKKTDNNDVRIIALFSTRTCYQRCA